MVAMLNRVAKGLLGLAGLGKKAPDPFEATTMFVMGGQVVTVEPQYQHFFTFRGCDLADTIPQRPNTVITQWLNHRDPRQNTANVKGVWKFVYTTAGDLWGIAFALTEDAMAYQQRFGVLEGSALYPMAFTWGPVYDPRHYHHTEVTAA